MLPAIHQHQPRAGTQYSHELYLAFQQCYRAYINRQAISEESQRTLEAIKVSGCDFDELVVQPGLNGKIELLDGQVVFNVFTLPP
jgi:hypothetical protein